MICLLSTAAGRAAVDELLDACRGSAPPAILAVLYNDSVNLVTSRPGAVIFTDLERLSPRQLERLAGIWTHVAQSGGLLRPLNHPLRVKRRYELLRELHERGVNAFDAYRLTEARPPRRYPVFLRAEEEGEEGEDEPRLLGTPSELAAAVDRLTAEGRTRDGRLVVEFAAETDERGLYRRFSAYCVAGRVIPARLLFSRTWRVPDARGPVDDWMLAEERAYLEANPYDDLLRSVFRLACIDFGRVDFGFGQGRLQIFGIDTGPPLYGPSDERQAANFPPHLRAANRLIEAFRSLTEGPRTSRPGSAAVLREAARPAPR